MKSAPMIYRGLSEVSSLFARIKRTLTVYNMYVLGGLHLAAGHLASDQVEGLDDGRSGGRWRRWHYGDER